MKQYKLLKDTPTLKAGTIFEEVISDFDGLKALTRITPVGTKISPQFTIEDIDNFDDWFEEISEEHKRWRAGYGEPYYYISDSGSIECNCDYRDSGDEYLYSVGNYGRTKNELIAKREYNIARQVLLDDADGGKFVRAKIIYYADYGASIMADKWNGDYTLNTYSPGKIYFKDKESLEESLEIHKEQWEIVRKYEMGEM
jgi:hypothetical protein